LVLWTASGKASSPFAEEESLWEAQGNNASSSVQVLHDNYSWGECVCPPNESMWQIVRKHTFNPLQRSYQRLNPNSKLCISGIFGEYTRHSLDSSMPLLCACSLGPCYIGQNRVPRSRLRRLEYGSLSTPLVYFPVNLRCVSTNDHEPRPGKDILFQCVFSYDFLTHSFFSFCHI
jgi:hypothetical protein